MKDFSALVTVVVQMKKNHFPDIDTLNPEQFEVFVGDLLQKCGWKNIVRTQPGRDYQWGDGGVDYICERNGKRFAVEAKHVESAEKKIAVSALNQVVTGAELIGIKRRLLITNGFFTKEVESRSISLGVELVDRNALKSMWESEFAEMGRKIRPRTYQAAVSEEILDGVRSGKSRFLIQMATGLGKTYTCAFVIREAIQIKPRKVLFVAHQVEILTQSISAFKNVLGIGSVSYSMSYEGRPIEDTDVVFATFATLYTRRKELEQCGFDVVVIDEAHHTPAKTYSAVLDCLNPEILIGMTATPHRLDGKDVFEIFGGSDGHVGKYDLAWALRHGHLAYPKYKVLIDDLTDKDIHDLDVTLGKSDINQRIFLHRRDDKIIEILMENLNEVSQIESHFSPKGIVYCRSIAHIESLLPHFDPGAATFVHSRQQWSQRRESIRQFREGEFKFILTCDLFNEGIDIPETNVLVFLRPTTSQSIFLQQLGRGLRKTATKSHVYVYDFVGSVEGLKCLNALRSKVSKTRVESESLAENEDGFESHVIHDYQLEVDFTDKAAKVMDLVESLEVNLKAQDDLIDTLRNTLASSEHPVLPDEYFEKVAISPDQVSVYFSSFFEYLCCVCSDDQVTQVVATELDRVIEEFKAAYNSEPQERQLIDITSFSGLPLVTEAELSVILSQSSEVNSSLADAPGSPSESNVQEEDGVMEITLEQKARNLASELGLGVLSVEDIHALNPEQKSRIQSSFGSTLLFLSLLKSD